LRDILSNNYQEISSINAVFSQNDKNGPGFEPMTSAAQELYVMLVFITDPKSS
jgi:hypothetical protein